MGRTRCNGVIVWMRIVPGGSFKRRIGESKGTRSLVRDAIVTATSMNRIIVCIRNSVCTILVVCDGYFQYIISLLDTATSGR